MGNAIIAGSIDMDIAFRRKNSAQFLNRAGFIRFLIVPTFKELQENPLRPFVIFGVAGAHLAAPVKGKTYFIELFAVTGNIFLGGLGRMLARLYGILLCGQPKGIVTHRVQHVIALVALVAGVDITGNVAQRMPHMQARAGGIGKHVQNVIFWFVAIVLGFESLVIGPKFLPLCFYLVKVIFAHFLLFLVVKCPPCGNSRKFKVYWKK